MKRGFTLIEMLISVTILSIMMLFLYKSYASLNHSNSFYKKEVTKITSDAIIKKVIFLDFSLAHTISILNQNTKEDAALLQSSNSLHKRYNPSIAYIVKNSKLYRLESLKPLAYPLSAESEFNIDYIGEVNSFKVYKSQNKQENISAELTLVHIDFKDEEDILLKVKVLNSDVGQ